MLPPEVTGNRDARAILSAYRRFRGAAEDNRLRPLGEAKLLVVGNEAVGKTSLICFLVQGIPRDPSEAKTPGTAIHEKIEVQRWASEAGGISLNIWDFGGQEVMRGTHRFFLTERSLYVLVLEDRREDDRSVEDWLKTIGNRGGDSPILLVINKSDRGKRDLRLDEDGLKRRYPALRAVLRTSCEPDEWASESIAALRQQIGTTLAEDPQLTHIRDRVPARWLEIKQAIAERARDERVLRMSEFQALCTDPVREDARPDEVIDDPDEQRALLRMLHDLGVIVAHGLSRDAPAAAREIHLLDPNWLTGAIYRLLNEPEIRDAKGEFAKAELNRWLDPGLYPPERYEFILTMMQDPGLGLCLPLPGTEARFLIPEALPPSGPDYSNWPADSLRFRYRYDFLPRSLIPRFIVESHGIQADKPTRWRSGVVLKVAKRCPVLVQADFDKRRIDIAVDGPEGLRRSALSVVLTDLEAVHDRNLEIGARAFVPLPGQPELEESYEHLLFLEEEEGPDHRYYPTDSGHAYRVSELLEGVRRDREPGQRARKRRSSEAGEPADIDEPVIKLDVSPKPGWVGLVSSWRFFSLACGVVSAALAVLLLLLPSSELRLLVGIPVALGALVTVLLLFRNPVNYYRRMLSIVILAGLAAATARPTLALRAEGEPGWFDIQWGGDVSPTFWVVWGVVVIVLVVADLMQER